MPKEYFDLPNGDKIFVRIYHSRHVDTFLVSGSHRKQDFPLKQADVRNLAELGNFCDLVDAYVESAVPRKKNLMDELKAMDGEFVNAEGSEFDLINP